MSGSKDNARIEDIQKIFHQKWPNHWPIGSKPGAKGCVVWNVEGSVPVVTQVFDKNADLFHALLDPRYHPGKTWPPDLMNLFGEMRDIDTGEAAQIRDLRNTMDKLRDIQETLELYPIDPNKPIIPQLTKIYNKLKQRV